MHLHSEKQKESSNVLNILERSTDMVNMLQIVAVSDVTGLNLIQ